MKKMSLIVALASMCLLGQPVFSQQTEGSLVTITGVGEIKGENDQAKALFFVEEQDADRGAATARVNRKMKEGIAILKAADPDAVLQARNYYTYPVYATANADKNKTITGWRVGQYVEFITTHLATLSSTVAKAQSILALNGLTFGLSQAALLRLDQLRLEAAYKNMTERAKTIAQAMGRDIHHASIESLEVDSSAFSLPEPRMLGAVMNGIKTNALPETTFEAGESTLTARIIGKFKFN